jgi:phytanoyl-CoA hydroxylase
MQTNYKISADYMSHGNLAVDGYELVKEAFPPSLVAAALDEVVAAIRRDPPSAHANVGAYVSDDLHIVRESKVQDSAVTHPENLVSRVFNCHTARACMTLARSPAIVQRVVEILGNNVDCFQSQCIFKSPGAIGQQWHQDSYYLPFDNKPQIGVWIALTDANLENSCLWVLPGSQLQHVHEHVPDRRPGANAGYVEIVDHDFKAAKPLVVQQGDAVFFHSHLMHKSSDNTCQERRASLVLHYARTGTQMVTPDPVLSKLTRWISVAP